MKKRIPKKLLLVDDDDALRDIIKGLLVKAGYEVLTAPNGNLAQELITLSEVDAVISDIHMPGRVSGIELCHFVKRTTKLPVILMTGFSTLAETKEADEIGADGFLAKPFKISELQAQLNRIFGEEPQPVHIAEETSEDEKYSKLGIDDFISGRQIKFNVFVRLSPSKYVKIAHQGEDLAIERIRVYKEKKIQHLYLDKADFTQYMRTNIGLSQAVRASPSINPQKKMHFMKHTSDLIMEQIFSNALNQDIFEAARSVVETSVSFLAESKDTASLLDSLNSHSDWLYAHSLGVSVYAAMMAKQIGWHSPQNIYKISIGGLFHDVGKKEIDPLILGKPRNTMNLDEIQLLETHTSRGMEILSRVSTVPDDVLQIALQHHERDQGTGYPSGLTKGRINPLARLIAVADEFCKLVIKNPDSPGIPPELALPRLMSLYGRTLEPQYINALVKVFKVPPTQDLKSSDIWNPI